MKSKRLFRLLAVILAVLLIFPALPIFAEDTTPPEEQTEEDNALKLIRMPKSEAETSGETTAVTALAEEAAVTPAAEEAAAPASEGARSGGETPVLLDGIYAFRNVGNSNMWLDIRADSTSPGAYAQQYTYAATPAEFSAKMALYRVTRVEGTTNTYQIAAMLNTALTFYATSDGYIKTRTQTSSDLFVIDYDGERCSIRFNALESGYIAAPNSTATGAAGAPQSNLVVSNLTSRAYWVPENILRNGVFTLQDANGLYMDIAHSKTVPGYHVQQYNFGVSSHTEINDIAGLWELAETDEPGLYTIRSVLANTLSFAASGTRWLTQSVPEQDADMGDVGKFWIEYTSSGYTIRAKSSDAYVCAPVGTASGAAGAPNSYLLAKDASGIDAYAKWQIRRRADVLANGVYAFENLGNHGLWLDVRQDSTDPDAYMQQYTYGRNPAKHFSRAGLFKITLVSCAEHRYIVRLMTDNTLSFTMEEGNFITQEINPNNGSVAAADTFYITYDNYGYVFLQYGGANDEYMTSPDSNASGYAQDSELLARSRSAAGARARWVPHKYTGTERAGHSFSFASLVLAAGSENYAKYEVWNTVQNAHSTRLTLPNNGVATVQWSGGADRLVFRSHQVGDFFVRFVTYKGDEPYYVTQKNFEVVLPTSEGLYCFRNRQDTAFVMQTRSDSEGAKVELRLLDYSQRQWFQIEHIIDGYYSIKSASSGLALTIDEDEIDEDRTAVIQEPYENTSRFHWKITNLGGDNFQISPKSGEDYNYVVAAGRGFLDIADDNIDDGLNVEQREYQEQNKYKWSFIPANVQLEAQLTDYWCWAAAARMVSYAFGGPIRSQQGVAVFLQTNPRPASYNDDPDESIWNNYNQGGDLGDICDAFCMFIGQANEINGDAWCKGYKDKIFDERTLQNTLDLSLPIIIGREAYDEDGFLNIEHAVVICGYFYDSGQMRTRYRLYNSSSTEELPDGYFHFPSYDWLCDTASDANSDIALGNQYKWRHTVCFYENDGQKYIPQISRG